ncbi:putative ABC transport system permease protein [Hamadaea flava]|uniref:ABC transporter permease n=1 Tax=Hamadaea flava TaxID=1742688 RepID=A0ABV8LVK7_9ACTN|nr:ABC transporter permease [Hamadaea flava]MCP2328337.1 putative ABC transport system permease protein [Hamadaea flava]
MNTLAPSRLAPADVVRVGAAGLRTRPVRAWLSALGIAIGIAAMVAVVGISSSSREQVNRELAALGTNLLTVSTGRTATGQDAALPAEAEAMIGRIGPVTGVSAIGRVPGLRVYRSDKIPTVETNALSVLAARTSLPGTVSATVRRGAWLNDATGRYPAAVLGASAATRLGIGRPSPAVEILVGGIRFTVIGVLSPVRLAPELDTAVLIGWDQAATAFHFDGRATTVYARVDDRDIEAVHGVLAPTANPRAPGNVTVSRPSEILAARRATDSALNGLLLGLGAVALLVGGVGVANTMVISVLERRAEIGLRRALGATRGQIRLQFLAESLLLSALGGIGGVALGVAVTTAYAAYQHWPSVVPAWASGGGLAATVVIGGLAGLYPAIRAARLSPTEALAAP